MSLRKILMGATSGAVALVAVAGGLPFISSGITHGFGVASAQAAQALPSFADLVERASPSVVTIMVKMERVAASRDASPSPIPDLPEGSPFKDFFDRFSHGPGQQQAPDEDRQPGQALGSGFIIDPSGYIVTNNHVVEQASEIKVVLADGRELEATLVGRDAKSDLALLKIDAPAPLSAVTWGDSDAVRVGDWAVAIGNPFGIGTTVTAGIVSARGRDIHAGPYDDFLQVDAAINRGNSGGPLFNETGQVIGVNTAILSPSGGNIGLGFAIPAKQAQSVVAQLKETGSVERGWIGVSIQPVTDDLAEGLDLKEAKGALVSEVIAGSPAAAAGLKQGDVILGFAGKPVKELRDLTRGVAGSPIGQTQALVVWRQGHEVSLTIQPARMEQTAATGNPATPSAEDPAVAHLPELGLTLGEVDDRVKQALGRDDISGVVVAAVENGKSAANSGLRPGDLILTIGQQAVSNAQMAKDAITQAESEDRKSLLLLVDQQGRQHYLALSLKA